MNTQSDDSRKYFSIIILFLWRERVNYGELVIFGMTCKLYDEKDSL